MEAVLPPTFFGPSEIEDVRDEQETESQGIGWTRFIAESLTSVIAVTFFWVIRDKIGIKDETN
jgi:hypothetical protein